MSGAIAVLFLVIAVRVTVAAAATSNASITVTPATAAPGSILFVELQNWKPGPVTVAVCGNAARRGSQDCDLYDSTAVSAGADGETHLKFIVTTPPVGCPCIVRATTATNDVVRAAPITLVGVPDGVNIPPATPVPQGRQLGVAVSLIKVRAGLADAVFPPLAGPVRASLVVMLHNRGASDLRSLRIEGGVGRKRSDSEPLRAVAAIAVPAGQTRRVTIPIRLGVPAWGHYEVYGTVYGAAEPTTFEIGTKNDPWALELIVPIVLLAWAEYLRLRDRARRNLNAEAEVGDDLDDTAEWATEGFPDSSPVVGEQYDERYEVASYAQPRHGPGQPREPEDDGAPLVGATVSRD